MAAINHDIGRFCAIFLPPADIMLTDDPVRYYFNKPTGEATVLLNALSAGEVDAVKRAEQAFQTKSDKIALASQPQQTNGLIMHSAHLQRALQAFPLLRISTQTTFSTLL